MTHHRPRLRRRNWSSAPAGWCGVTRNVSGFASGSPHRYLKTCASSSSISEYGDRRAWWAAQALHKCLSPLFKKVSVLARNRQESHFAGIVLNSAEDSVRFSHDFDIFHELAEEVTRQQCDVESLRAAGFQSGLSRHGEWERNPASAKPVGRGSGPEIDWAADSAFRFSDRTRPAVRLALASL